MFLAVLFTLLAVLSVIPGIGVLGFGGAVAIFGISVQFRSNAAGIVGIVLGILWFFLYLGFIAYLVSLAVTNWVAFF